MEDEQGPDLPSCLKHQEKQSKRETSLLTLDYRPQRRVTPERRDMMDGSLVIAQLPAWSISRPQHRKGTKTEAVGVTMVKGQSRKFECREPREAGIHRRSSRRRELPGEGRAAEICRAPPPVPCCVLWAPALRKPPKTREGASGEGRAEGSSELTRSQESFMSPPARAENLRHTWGDSQKRTASVVG